MFASPAPDAEKGTTMNTYRIIAEPDGTYTVDGGITGQDGFRSHKAARYAIRIACWGVDIPTPEQADQAIAGGWEE